MEENTVSGLQITTSASSHSVRNFVFLYQRLATLENTILYSWWNEKHRQWTSKYNEYLSESLLFCCSQYVITSKSVNSFWTFCKFLFLTEVNGWQSWWSLYLTDVQCKWYPFVILNRWRTHDNNSPSSYARSISSFTNKLPPRTWLLQCLHYSLPLSATAEIFSHLLSFNQAIFFCANLCGNVLNNI